LHICPWPFSCKHPGEAPEDATACAAKHSTEALRRIVIPVRPERRDPRGLTIPAHRIRSLATMCCAGFSR